MFKKTALFLKDGFPYSKLNFPSKKCDLNSKFNFSGGIVEGARHRDKWTDRDRRNHSL